MSLYRALTSFSGDVAGAPGQIVEINDKDVVKDLTRAGYIEKLSKDEESAEQSRRDAEAKRLEEAEEARAKSAAEEPVTPREPGPSAAETQHALNEELRGNAKSKSARKTTGTPEEATAAYQGAETNAQDAAANPKPTVNAAKSGQTSQGGVDVTPAKDPNSTLGTSQAEDDPSATISKEKGEENQAAVEAQAEADKAAAKAATENAEHGPVSRGAEVTLPPATEGDSTPAPASTKNTTPSNSQKSADQAKASAAAKSVTRPSSKK